MLYGHASYCIGDEEWRTCRLGFFLISCFRDEKWMRDFEGDEGDEGGIAAAVPVLLVLGAVE